MQQNNLEYILDQKHHMTQNPKDERPTGVVFVAQTTCFQDPSLEFCVSWPIQLRQQFRNGTPVCGFFGFFLGSRATAIRNPAPNDFIKERQTINVCA